LDFKGKAIAVGVVTAAAVVIMVAWRYMHTYGRKLASWV